MTEHSTWNRVDLHIHSKKSNEVKGNDYRGEEYSAEDLLKKLSENDIKINIFSITDHNCINDRLYKEIQSLILLAPYNNQINYVIGVELDVYDTNIYEDVFHCLCFFDSKNVDDIKSAIDMIFDGKSLSERNLKENYPDITKIFKKLGEKNIQDIILIPHYNNKSKGLPTDIAIENLNYLCFNAYEDSNNIANINKSLKIYLKAGYDNFPFAVFSDCHDIQNYPGNNMEDFIPCYMLGNIRYPFNSVKNAFQEPRLRISLDHIENVRKREIPKKYIEKILLNGKKYDLSPYQNTIIGKFGSGKSLLLQKIKEGSSSLRGNEKYNSFYSPEENFKLFFSNDQFNSINEILTSNKDVKTYEFLQQEDYSFKSYLTLHEARSLFGRINIKYDFVESKKFDFNIDNMVQSFNNAYFEINSNSEINNLNYENTFSEEEFFSINLLDYETDYHEIIIEMDDANQDLENLKNKKVSSISLFDNEDKLNINRIITKIDDKLIALDFLANSVFENEIKEVINDYNKKYINNNAKQIKAEFDKNLDKFLLSLNNLNLSCNIFESQYNKDVYENIKKPIINNVYKDYNISASYLNLDEYKSPVKGMMKETDRKKDLFTSLLSTIYNKSNFLQNKKYDEFKLVIEKYCDSVSKNFVETNVAYDIMRNQESLLKKSAGEKSSLFIKLIFDLIENDLQKKYNIILILDQPESNIDNDNIYKEISEKLRKLKIEYNNFQSIIVTHSANVGIAADSESIIIAQEEIDNENIKHFNYSSGCIENKKFIAEVCNILEGGKKALERRTIKYGINIIKKVEKNEL